MSTRGTKVASGVVSTILFVIAACTLAATVGLGWLYGTRTDGDGFVTDSDTPVSTGGYAITSTELDFGSVPQDLFPTGLVGTFRVEAESETGSPIFLGVGPSHEVDEYLADVEHIDVTRFGSGRLVYTEHDGSESPRQPSDLEVWTASSEGDGRQTLDWEPESGTWTLVVMNSNGAPGLDLTASVGFATPWLLIGLVITGLLTVLFGGLGIVAAIPMWGRHAATDTPEPTSSESTTLAR